MGGRGDSGRETGGVEGEEGILRGINSERQMGGSVREMDVVSEKMRGIGWGSWRDGGAGGNEGEWKRL